MSPEAEGAAEHALALELLRRVQPAAYVAESDQDEAHQLVRVDADFFPLRDALLGDESN